jgi:hypothetical protein
MRAAPAGSSTRKETDSRISARVAGLRILVRRLVAGGRGRLATLSGKDSSRGRFRFSDVASEPEPGAAGSGFSWSSAGS